VSIITFNRKTKETDVSLKLGASATIITTGVGFLDHMLTALFFYANIGVELSALGDLHVDAHHTVEDVGIAVGSALHESLGDRVGIRRFSHAFIPMDEALGFCALDISGRAHLEYDVTFPQERIGEYESCLTLEFFRALVNNCAITLHFKKISGENSHHITETLFKAFGVAWREASEVVSLYTNSTKGVL
jgi:imidazoleglycerol-phosphate dehydratase